MCLFGRLGGCCERGWGFVRGCFEGVGFWWVSGPYFIKSLRAAGHYKTGCCSVFLWLPKGVYFLGAGAPFQAGLKGKPKGHPKESDMFNYFLFGCQRWIVSLGVMFEGEAQGALLH